MYYYFIRPDGGLAVFDRDKKTAYRVCPPEDHVRISRKDALKVYGKAWVALAKLDYWVLQLEQRNG